jgi:hypothetical protein
VVQVHCDEGVAIHVDPEPCAGNREVVGEASAGERIGQPLSRENLIYPRVPTRSKSWKATWTSALREHSPDPAWSKTLACAEALCTGTGRSRV